MKNQDLKKRYDQIYKEGEATFFSKFMDNTNISETDAYVLAAAGWEGKSVLDAGCGTGKTAYLISQSGAKQVVGIDFSEEAIKVAKQKFNAPNLYYSCMELHEWRETVDVIVSCGTLEHMDRPWDTFAMMSKLIPAGGQIIITCPCFLNIRGFVWMGLQTLLNVPMSLTDVHFISPFDIEEWLRDTRLQLVQTESFDYSRGNGPLMLADLRKRLTNALRDASLDNTRVEAFIGWLGKVVHYMERTRPSALDGATALYMIQKVDG